MVSRSAWLWGSVVVGVSLFVLAGTSWAEPGTPPLAVAPFDAEEARAHQEVWAEYLRQPVEMTTRIAGGVELKMALIPPGEFMMGSPESERQTVRAELVAMELPKPLVELVDSEGLQHRVRITRPFYLGVYPVTQSQWKSVMGSNPSRFSVDGRNRERVSGMSTGDFPVEGVSWQGVQEFLDKLNEQSGETGSVYRLPTEAEWEYACRAGTTTRYYFGDDERDLGRYAWYSGQSGGLREGRTDRVGQRHPNAWGLYDMHGNVWEWCSDWWGADYYANSPLEDPTGPTSGSYRALRGGGWGHVLASDFRASRRVRLVPRFRGDNQGFRLVRTASSGLSGG